MTLTSTNPASTRTGDGASDRTGDHPNPWLIAFLLACITLLAGAGSLYWVRANVVIWGHDSAGYLGTTFEQYAILNSLSVQTFFQAFMHDNYRTPAFYMAVQPFLRWFGPNPDSAQLLNVLLVALLVPLTWLLARQVAAAWTALFAALLVALLPMIAAMGRLYYTEALLTTAVTFILIALYRCNGFAHRGWSLAWGAALGMGMLIKWTIPLYILLPMLWVLWRARRTLFAGSLRFRWRSLLLATGVALLFVMVWYWPNRVALQDFVLGGWLLWLWLLIALLAAYFMLEGRGSLPHLAAALLLALWIASLWYLPYIDIVPALLVTDDVRGVTYQGLFSQNTFARYFIYLYHEHLGEVVTWVVAPIVLFAWLRALLQRRGLLANSALLWLSLLSTYIGLALIAQANERNIVPILPALCVLAAVAVADYRPPWRTIFGVLIAGLLFVQWLSITTDRMAPVHALTSLWAGREYALPPASGFMDPAYAVGPEIVAELARYGPERQELGMLVNSPWLHRGSLRNIAREANAPVQIRDLTEADATWPRLITSPWLLAKDGDNRDVEPEGRTLLARTLADPLFSLLFAPVRTWQVPSGETVTLYRRSGGPDFGAVPAGAMEQSAIVVDFMRNGWSDHATLVYTGLDRGGWVARANPPNGPAVLAFDEAGLDASAIEPLNGTLFVVLQPGTEKVVRRLNQQAYKVAEAGGDYLWAAVYGKPARPLEVLDTEALAASWQGHAIAELRTLTTLQPGEVIPLDVRFALPADEETLKWSVRLVDGEGNIVAVSDRALAPADRFGLLVPPATPPGRYALVAVAYEPATLDNVPTDDGRESLQLAEITVQP
jgi:4-amino-4-deoxy-L-arabinose transferase-like glycosyltransferase